VYSRFRAVFVEVIDELADEEEEEEARGAS
jgi:hypothetical protein